METGTTTSDDRSGLERRLLAQAEFWERYSWDTATPALIREAALAIGELRRAMLAAIDDDTGLSAYRLLRFQAILDRLEGGRDGNE